MTVVTVLDALRRLKTLAEPDSVVWMLSKYIAELSLLDEKFHDYSPGIVACSCHFLAKKILRQRNSWTPDLEAATGIKRSEIIECTQKLAYLMDSVMVENPQNESIVKKYSKPSKFEVSKIRFRKDSEPCGPNPTMEQIRRHDTLDALIEEQSAFPLALPG